MNNPISVTSKFSPSQLSGKSLCWYRRENRYLEGSLMVCDIQAGGRFILYLRGVSVDLSTPPEVKTVQAHQWSKPLDQDTVALIEETKTFSALPSFDFVIFEQSPKSRKLYLAEGQ